MNNQIVFREINELSLYENNPRYNDKAVSKVAESIKEFGFLVPIVIDCNNVIVAGETRLKAAKKLLMTKVPCIVANNLTDEQIRAFRLIENKTSEFASWDFEKLRKELKSIDIDISQFDFPDFSDMELDVTDDDFLQDTEIVKDRDKKSVECPNCGHKFAL